MRRFAAISFLHVSQERAKREGARIGKRGSSTFSFSTGLMFQDRKKESVTSERRNIEHLGIQGTHSSVPGEHRSISRESTYDVLIPAESTCCFASTGSSHPDQFFIHKLTDAELREFAAIAGILVISFPMI